MYSDYFANFSIFILCPKSKVTQKWILPHFQPIGLVGIPFGPVALFFLKTLCICFVYTTVYRPYSVLLFCILDCILEKHILVEPLKYLYIFFDLCILYTLYTSVNCCIWSVSSLFWTFRNLYFCLNFMIPPSSSLIPHLTCISIFHEVYQCIQHIYNWHTTFPLGLWDLEKCSSQPYIAFTLLIINSGKLLVLTTKWRIYGSTRNEANKEVFARADKLTQKTSLETILPQHEFESQAADHE